MSETAITKREVNPAGMQVRSLADLQSVGKWLAQSGMFGVSNEAQGVIVAMACNQSGMNIMEFRETYHIINGTPSMRADAMLARFAEMGGRYVVKARTAAEARAVFTMGDASYESVLTWDDAQKEPFVYVGKEADIMADLAAGNKPKLKAKYATPRSRMQMLWARVISDGVRTVCPGANKGNYTPEEVSDFEPGVVRTMGPISAEEVSRRVEAAKPVEVIDPATFCPLAGDLNGVPWASMDDTTLTDALHCDMAEITAAHKAVIVDVLAAREGVK